MRKLFTGESKHLQQSNRSGAQASQENRQSAWCLISSRKLHASGCYSKNRKHERTQEFVLSWSPNDSDTSSEIVRQQYNFSPAANTRELEDYTVNLDGVLILDMNITPDISGGNARASLARLRLA
jgi:hypothetical protein